MSPHALRSALLEVGRREIGLLLTVALLAGGAWVFIEVADEVMEGSTAAVDRWLLLSLRNPADLADPVGPRWLEELGRDLTALGGATVLGLLTVAVVGYLALARTTRSALFVSGAVVGAALLSYGLKNLFGRARPDLVTQHSYVVSASFPSGHAMLSAAVYLTLGALLARLQKRLIEKAYVLLWAWTLTLLVGVSRVYVGVHWPTDVLGGWAAGAAWAALCSLLARALQRRGELEA